MEFSREKKSSSAGALSAGAIGGSEKGSISGGDKGSKGSSSPWAVKVDGKGGVGPNSARAGVVNVLMVAMVAHLVSLKLVDCHLRGQRVAYNSSTFLKYLKNNQ